MTQLTSSRTTTVPRPSAARQLKPLLTIRQVAERCSVSERTIRRWIQAGELRAHQLGGHLVRVSEEDLATFLTAYRTG